MKKSKRFTYAYKIVSFVFLPTALVFLLLMYLFRFQPILQFETALLFALLYVFSALVHHHFDKTLTFEIMIEYILIALLSLIILGGQLF